MVFPFLPFLSNPQHACGLAYWSGSKKNEYQSMWFKHATILGYSILYLLSLVVDIRAHDVCVYFRVLLYLSVHRRTVLVVTQLRYVAVLMYGGGGGGALFGVNARVGSKGHAWRTRVA